MGGYNYDMTTEKKRAKSGFTPDDKIQNAADFGIDISMLLDNIIKKTPAERIRRHQIALNTAQKLRKAKPK